MVARYVGRRFMQVGFVLWLAVTLAFVAMQLTPGDPAQALLAASGATPDEVTERRAQLGLDNPVPVQYARYLLDLVSSLEALTAIGEHCDHVASAGQGVEFDSDQVGIVVATRMYGHVAEQAFAAAQRNVIGASEIACYHGAHHTVRSDEGIAVEAAWCSVVLQADGGEVQRLQQALAARAGDGDAVQGGGRLGFIRLLRAFS